MRLIDTHCHLVSEKLRDNAQALVDAARAAGVEKIIDIAYDPETVDLALEQVQRFPSVYAALGIQPHDAHSYTEAEAARIESLARANPRVVAIGEIGLDAFYTLSPMEVQHQCFEHFLDVACRLGLPVVVHVRETHADVIARMRQAKDKGLTGVIHCFTGTLDEAREFLDLGLFLSFSGIVTFKNATALKEVARYVPDDRILVETDSPYLAPVPMRGKTNEPAFVAHTCAYVAALRGNSPESLAELTTANAERLFPRLLLG